MPLKNNKRSALLSFLIKMNPVIKKEINNDRVNLIDDGIIDSFDIIQIISKIEKIGGKKINPKNIKRESFSNINNMLKLLK